MGSYRLEESKTSRAGCQNKECKDQKVKIQKGELRFGTYVDTERIQAFMWRHWGCVTPALISNVVKTLDEDGNSTEDLDGFDEISEELQDKVRKAIEQGHVDDDDWKGDVEVNRPGKSGFRVRVSKKAKAAAEDARPEEKEETPKSKKRTAKADEDKEAPAAKKPKKTSRAKKAASEDEESDAKSEEEEPKPKPAAKKARASRASKAKPADDEGEDQPAEEKPKRTRRKAAAKSD